MKGSLDGLPIMLAGNKSEEGGARREVAYRTGEALQVREASAEVDWMQMRARKMLDFYSLQTLQEMWNCKYIETSAKTGKNVDELFEQLLKMERTVSLTLQQPEERKRAGRRCAIV